MTAAARRASAPADALLDLHTDAGRDAVNLVLLDFDPKSVFAGVKTALEAGSFLGARTGRDVRLVLLNPTGGRVPTRDELLTDGIAWLERAFPDTTWRIACDDDLHTERFGTGDLWVATHWMTAHALDRAATSGLVGRSRVIYLIQDFEPDFTKADAQRELAVSTYGVGFIPVVNTLQVASYLQHRGLADIDPRLVFAPQFDLPLLSRVAARRRRAAVPTVFFYGRPSKPRNMYELGIASLRVAAVRTAEKGLEVDFVMAGEDGPDIDLGHGRVLRNLGLLERSAYFDLIAHVDAGLTLQATPHPSHLPFDLAITGVPAVTNDIDGARSRMHPRILAGAGKPEELGRLLVAALEASRRTPADRLTYLPVPTGQLGGTIGSALDAALDRIERASR